MELTFIAPHHDDIAFSCSLFLQECIDEHHDISIINCFTKSNYNLFGDKMETIDLAQNTMMRTEEDIAFFSSYSTKANRIDLALNDAPLRNDLIIQRPFEEEEDLAEFHHLKEKMLHLDKSNYVIPLTLGNHIDHVITSNLFVENYRNKIYAFYEDLPYAGELSEKQILQKIIDFEVDYKISLKPYLVEGFSFQFKKDKCWHYKSQIDKEILGLIEKQYIRLNNSERIWLVE